MSRFTMAFGSFFSLLFKGKLPEKAAKFLPAGSVPKHLPEPKAERDAAPKSAEEKPKAAKPSKPKVSVKKHHADGGLAMLALLQREGRLIDFLQESIEDYDDADIGAAVRDIHRGCNKVLKENLSIEAVMPGEEDDKITVPKGFDPGEIKLLGAVSGQPPFKGILRHHGWRVKEVNLPTLSPDADRKILAPAQVEIA